MKRAQKFLIALLALVILLALFGRPPSAWKRVRVGMTWEETNAIINQRGVITESRVVASTDGQEHTARTFFCYKEFIVFPLWVFRVDLLDTRVASTRIGLRVGDIEKISP
ncbi:MAG: hypothetical protein HY301_01895 [Verrucomicrobia bacterium]|nr:hypothetical protein [Verrucomicrobiota bacterium]